MKKSILLLATIAVLASSLPVATNAATQVYDLKDQWSVTDNPNGTWSYRQGDSLLIGNPFPWVGPGYTGCNFGCSWPPSVPGIEKVTGTVGAEILAVYEGYLEDGDVLVIPGLGGNILWTAPESGTIDISGATWWPDANFPCFFFEFSASFWTLSRNGSFLSGGDSGAPLCGNETNPRSSPYDLSLGSGGAAALQNISVQAGDQLVLAFSGFPIGLNYTITLTTEGSGGCPNASFAEDTFIWHQPLARNGASEDTDPSAGRTMKYRFKRGSTIPIKVHALGCTADVTSNANIIGNVTVFGDSNCAGADDANPVPIDFNGLGGGGGMMDKIDGHLKYNLDTKSLPSTTQCYILRVTVTDTSTGEEKFEEVLLQAK